VLGRLGLDLTDVAMNGTSVRCMNSALRAPPRPGTGGSPRGTAGLDVADGAADLDQRDVDAPCAATDAALDLVGDVRDDLHRLAEVVAATLLADHAS
jgi:hypothetical protein